MTLSPMSPVSGQKHAHSPLSWGAVGSACAAMLLMALGAAGLGGAGAGMVLSIAAFVMAIVATARHERWVMLWVPLAFFPALVVSSPFWV